MPSRQTFDWKFLIDFLSGFVVWIWTVKFVFFSDRKRHMGRIWYTYRVCHGFRLTQARWLFLGRFWPLSNQAVFLEEAGAVLKIGSSLTRKFSLPKSVKRSVENTCTNSIYKLGFNFVKFVVSNLVLLFCLQSIYELWKYFLSIEQTLDHFKCF